MSRTFSDRLMRAQLHSELRPGDTLELESTEDEITLRPLRGNAPLRKKKGIWVFAVGEPLANEDVGIGSGPSAPLTASGSQFEGMP